MSELSQPAKEWTKQAGKQDGSSGRGGGRGGRAGRGGRGAGRAGAVTQAGDDEDVCTLQPSMPARRVCTWQLFLRVSLLFVWPCIDGVGVGILQPEPSHR